MPCPTAADDGRDTLKVWEELVGGGGVTGTWGEAGEGWGVEPVLLASFPPFFCMQWAVVRDFLRRDAGRSIQASYGGLVRVIRAPHKEASLYRRGCD